MKTCLTVAALTASLASIAHAEIVQMRFDGTGRGQNIRVESPMFNGNVFAGQLRHIISDGPAEYEGTWITYCADLAHHVTRTTSTYEIVPVSALPDSDPMGPAKAAAIRDLYAYAAGTQLLSTASNNYAAAFQIAIWEIILDYNPVLTGYGLNVTSGLFRAKSTSGSALSSGILSHLTTLFGAIGNVPESGAAIMGLRSGAHQDQIIPVPAPGSAFLCAIGTMFLAARPRRR
jgi:hypothetical protein